MVFFIIIHTHSHGVVDGDHCQCVTHCKKVWCMLDTRHIHQTFDITPMHMICSGHLSMLYITSCSSAAPCWQCLGLVGLSSINQSLNEASLSAHLITHMTNRHNALTMDCSSIKFAPILTPPPYLQYRLGYIDDPFLANRLIFFLYTQTNWDIVS